MIWIDLETAAGARLGDGPLSNVLVYEQVRRLSRAGEFSCQFNVSGTRYAALGDALRQYVRMFGRRAGLPTQLGRGIVENWQVGVSAPGRVTVSLRGDDLLRELAWATVGALAVEEESSACLPLAVLRHDPDADTNISLYDVALGIGTTQFVYVAYTDPFTAWRPTIAVGNAQASVLKGQVLRQPGQEPFWDDVPDLVDGTAVGGATLAQTGTVSWTMPDFWEPMRHNGLDAYWARFAVSADATGINWGSSHLLTGPGPTANGLAAIMALAAGWNLDTTNGYGTTATAVRWRFAGESVLAALIKIADLTGESFRLGDGRSVIWLRGDTPHSGIRAVSYSGDPEMINNNDVALIVDFAEERSSYDSLVGRLYAVGQPPALLALSTATPPAGWSVGSDALGEYIQHNDTYSAYGQSSWLRSAAKTPDELYNDAYRELDRRRGVYEAYRLTVSKVDVALRPGQLLRVVYQKTQDGVMLYDIDADFAILEMRETTDSAGRQTIALRLATKPRWPRTHDQEAIARLL